IFTDAGNLVPAVLKPTLLPLCKAGTGGWRRAKRRLIGLRLKSTDGGTHLLALVRLPEVRHFPGACFGVNPCDIELVCPLLPLAHTILNGVLGQNAAYGEWERQALEIELCQADAAPFELERVVASVGSLSVQVAEKALVWWVSPDAPNPKGGT